MTLSLRGRAVGAAALLALAGAARAQQFQQVTAFPGTARWSEGLECADVDRDGDLDVFVADGDGFNSAGTARQNVLLINQLVETAPWTFADESLARLGAHTSHAKGVTTGDVDGDGWVAALYLNAFFTSPPSLYVNQGAANPGHFSFEGASRGFTTSYSSGSGMFADLDDDGDLDLILNDRYNSAVAAKPHLFFNDGSGHFTENAAALGAPSKASQMDVQLVDVDGDLDLDFFGPNKATNPGGNHYLMLNSGAGTFSDVSSLVSAGTGSVYEAEAGDLDGDTDLDLFFVSLSGFQEGSVRNNVVGAGTLGFTNQGLLGGLVDDNEIALGDYDVDGDYDVFVGSLGSHEYLYRNDGGFAFVDRSVEVQTIADSTLDCTLADLDNDGRYDLLTAQGESVSAQWANKFYRNTGPVDTRAPVVVAHATPATAPAAGPVVAHARVRDQVLDDGVDYVSASASYVVRISALAVDVVITDAGFAPDPLAVAPGTAVTWTNQSSVPRNVAAAAPWGFDSGVLPVGGSYASTFVEAGSVALASEPGGLTGTVSVAAGAASAHATRSGSGLWRFRFDDTAGGLGQVLCYQLRFVDWPGNATLTEGRCVTLLGDGPGHMNCAGDGSLATPCPCGDDGADGHGCANSVEAAGALLVAGGTANPDALVLGGSGMPASVSCIYLQGDAFAPQGIVFGDGLRCADGQLIRLRTKQNVAGASQFPEAGDPSVSQRGMVTPGSGAVRQYQTYYRNAAAAFCPPSTFNVTNGVEIVW